MKKGQVTTPVDVVSLMVEKLFSRRSPTRDDTLLDPGCGSGAFIKGVVDWCNKKGTELPNIIGVESDPVLFSEAQKLFEKTERVKLLNEDVLLGDFGVFDFVIGNPPYVHLEGLSEKKRKMYRKQYESAKNRFDLYILFFEKALKVLKPSGYLVFVTPEKYEYTISARLIRTLMTRFHVEEMHHISEETFKGYVTYPVVTVIKRDGVGPTKVVHRDGSSGYVNLPTDGSRWISVIRGESELGESGVVLEDVCLRISCGVATGADKIFVMRADLVPENLKVYAYPTVGGKDLSSRGIKIKDRMIIPYDKSGRLPQEKLKQFKSWLSKYRDILSDRYCVRKGKREWYEFHENPPMSDILRPKILCKDITKEPSFSLDEDGSIVPRHSVYYIVPKYTKSLSELHEYLCSEQVQRWLVSHCQRAANDFIRLQSSVLKMLPVPHRFVNEGHLDGVHVEGSPSP